MAFHLHQPMAPLALADLTTASRPVGPRTASAEPVSTGPVLSSEPARAPLIVAPLHTTPVQPPTVLDGASLALAPSQIGAAARATEAPARPAASSATVRPATIFFGRGVAALSAPELQLLSQVVAELRADQRLVLTGRTDLTGSQRANEQLGLARAGRVKAALVKLGVEAERIDVRVDTSGRQGLIKNVRFVRQPGDLAAQLRRVDIEVVR